MTFRPSILPLLAALSLACGVCLAQAPPAVEPLTVTKVDPPNWFAGLPTPVLLIHGTGLSGAQFQLSDSSMRIERASISANGHWAQLALSSSPARPETVEVRVEGGGQSLRVPFRFDAPRGAADGMQGFNARDVLYLIMTDRFADGNAKNDGEDAQSPADSPQAAAERAKARGWHGGDIPGVLQHLDYLQQLGVTTVWLTPVYSNRERDSYHGYGATDYYGVDPHFGSLGDLQQLADALHARHMKLVLDTVPNHIGPAHPWAADEPAPDWLHGTRATHVRAVPNLESLVSPHGLARDRVNMLHGWFADTLPDMNTDSPAVAAYLRQNAVWWVEETGTDGLRIDTFPYVNREFWNAFNGELSELFPRLTEVGEVFDSHPVLVSAFAGGVTRGGADTRLYTPFDFPTYFAVRDVFAQGKPMSELADILADDSLYPHPERLVPFVGNHDVSRIAEAVPDSRLRSLAFTYLLTTRGVPQLYSGDEIGMRGGDDPANRQDFPGGFTPAEPSPNAFLASGRSPEQQQTYESVRDLLDLRRAHPVLACGEEQVLAASDNALVYARYGAKSCPDLGSAPAQPPLLIFLERGVPAPLTVNLRGTALEGCKPEAPLLGRADAKLGEGGLALDPHTPAVILPCRL